MASWAAIGRLQREAWYICSSVANRTVVRSRTNLDQGNVMATMSGVVLPGDSTVKHVQVDIPEPGHGQVLLQMKASSICGSDIRAIYREHLGSGPEAYRE